MESAAWNDKSDVLTAIADGRLITWYYPNAVSIDRDLLGLASTSRDAAEFGKVRGKVVLDEKFTIRSRFSQDTQLV